MVGFLAENLFNELNNLIMIDILTFEALTKSHDYLKKIGSDNTFNPEAKHVLNLVNRELMSSDLQALIKKTPIIKIKSKTVYGRNLKAKSANLESMMNFQVQEIKEDYELNMNDGGSL